MIKFIADIGSCHNQDFDRCQELIQTAKEIGCWGVKFQLFNSTLYRPGHKAISERLSKWALPIGWLPEIARVCNGLDIKFGCTPFYVGAIRQLKKHVDFLKIGSYELLWLDLIKACAKVDKPLFISCGMAKDTEITTAMMTANNARPTVMTPFYKMALFHCNSAYPASPEDCYLYRIEKLREHYRRMDIGWSDHTTHPSVVYQAIASGATMIEFHLDLADREGWESEYGHCWTPDKMGDVIETVRYMEKARGIHIPPAAIQGKWDELRNQRTSPKDGMRPLKGGKK